MSFGAYVKVPTSLVEHLWLLTPAETAMCLVVLRRGSRNGEFIPVSVTESNWQKWTGLSARQREYAIAGLREKGLKMEGRGDKAVFSFDLAAFRAYASAAVPAEAEVRTKGRARGVAVPAGTVVHEDCKKNGCQMLCGSAEQSCKPVLQMPVRKPAAAAESMALGAAVVGGNGVYADLRKTRAPRRPGFRLTLAVLRELGFALAGDEFISRLVAACEGFKRAGRSVDFDDELLSRAVRLAYEQRRHMQKSEGLFLVTVPPLLIALSDQAAARSVAYSCGQCGDTGMVIVEDGRDEFGAVLKQVPCVSCSASAGSASASAQATSS